MSITRVGTGTASATTVTIPAHQAGDLIVIFAMHGGATTIPTLPAGYLTPNGGTKTNSTATALGCRIGYKFATGTSDTSGTWTNASELICHVYRASAGNVLRLGQIATSSSTTATVTYPALSPMGDSGGNSWVLGFIAASNLTQAVTTAPTGMTNESSVTGASYQAAGFDTTAGVSSWTSQTANVTGTGSTVSMTWEITLCSETNNLSSYVYQHIKGGGNPWPRSQTGNAYNCPVDQSCGSGNFLIIKFSNDAGATISSVSGAVNGAFTKVVTVAGGTGNLDTSVYIFPNATAGQETITVTFGASTTAFEYEITELYNVATSFTATSGTTYQTRAYSTTVNTGAFTPPNNNGTGGNFIWANFVKAEAGNTFPTKFATALYPGTSGFQLMSADIGWGILDNQNTFPKSTQGYIQATSASITPALTSLGDGDNWNSVALAIPVSSGSGTAPANQIRFNSVQHFATDGFGGSTGSGGTASYPLQCPAIGNCRVVASDDPSLHSLTVHDNEGNTWLSAGTGSGIWYLLSAAANPNLMVFIDGGGTDSQVSWRYYDLSNVGAFDSFTAQANSPTGTTFTLSPSPTPVASTTMTIINVGLGNGPCTGISSGPTGGAFALCTYTGELDTDVIENADCSAHVRATASGAQTWTFFMAHTPNTTSGGSLTLTESVSGGVTYTLAGQSITSTEGSVSDGIGYSVTGESIASTEGALTYGVSYAITGQAITSTEGVLTASLSYGLIGQAITSAEGAITRAVSYGLSGQSAVFTEGAITASVGGNVTKSLTGQAIASAEGTLLASISYALGGHSIASSFGSPLAGLGYTLAGESAEFSEGAIRASGGQSVGQSNFAQALLVTVSTGRITAQVLPMGSISPVVSLSSGRITTKVSH